MAPWAIRSTKKPTHTNLYLNPEPHHYLSNKQAVLATLVHRARALTRKASMICRNSYHFQEKQV
jgi:hypothetical protein